MVTYWDCVAVAAMFGMRPAAVRRRCRLNEWPHLPVEHRTDRKRFWFSAEHIEEIRQRQEVTIDDAHGVLPLPSRGPYGVVVDESEQIASDDEPPRTKRRRRR